MIIHEFRCVVLGLVLSERTGRMSHFQFRVGVHALMHSNERWGLPFESQWLLRTIDPQNLLKARPEQITHIRDAFLTPELGFFIHGRFMGHPGLEIAPEFRRDTEKPRGAASAPPPQMELPLSSGLAVLPLPMPAANSGLRTEKKKNKTKTETRARGRSPENISFSDGAWIEDRTGSDAPVWKELCLFLGAEEMARCGQMWMRRMDIRRDLIETLLREVGRQETRGVENRGAWFTAIFEERRRLWG